MGAMHGNMTKRPEVKDVKVAKATGPDARTVEEIVKGSAKLKGKPVSVRGTVVRFTSGVLGKNWVHLQDGTGSAAEKTHDVLVTTQDSAKIGEVVVAKGVVQTDLDLGSGYSYKVLVDNAKLQK
jgi:hypothetical protein